MSGPAASASGRLAGRSDGWLFAGLSLLVLVLFLLSLGVGRAPIPLIESYGHLFADNGSVLALILQEIRLPRAILATMIGATLGLAGAALQGLLRNPLAEPSLIGVSGSAALGAVVMFYFGFAAAFPLALPLGGMAGALVSVVLIHLLAGRGSSGLSLILAGIAINSLAAALTSLALSLAPNPYAAMEILFWLLGSLADRSFEHVQLAAPFMVVGWILLAGLGRPLEALSLGEETARTLGVDLKRLRLRLVLGVALTVVAAVSVAGSIGFIGLVVPHILRPLVGHRPGVLLPASALGGASLTLAADIAVRLVSTGPELRLGVFTALVGAPFFLWLVVKVRREVL